MAANSKNKNGSDFVTARHGGDGKGKMSTNPKRPGTTGKPINHTGGVNPPPDHGGAKGGAKEGSPAEEKSETPQEEASEQGENTSQDTGVHPYIGSMAAKLQAHHGLTHNHAHRIAAAITKVHAKGHASVDSKTQSAAAEAHEHMEGLKKKHGTATKAATGGK